MPRTGRVAKINATRGMVAITTPDDGFTIIEIISAGNFAVGDSVSWANGYGLGSEVYQNLTQGRDETVLVQNHAVKDQNLRRQLLL